MHKKNITIFKGTGLLTASDFLSRILELLRIIFITHIFSVKDFGLFSLASGTALIFASFVMPNFENAVTQFYAMYRKINEEKAKKFCFSTLTIVIVNGVVLFLIFNLLARWIASNYYQKPEIMKLLMISSIMIVIQPLADMGANFLLSREKFGKIFFGNTIFAFSNLALIIAFFYGGFGVESMMYSLIGGYGIRAMIFCFFLRKVCIVCMPKFEKEVWKFWYPLIGASTFKSFTGNLPLIIIGRYLDTFSMGLYQIAEKTVKLIFAFIEPYLNVVRIICINTFHESKKHFTELLNTHLKYSIFFNTIIGILGIVGAKIIFSLLYGEEYSNAIPLFLYLILFGVFGTANVSFPRTIYSVTHKNIYYLYNSIISTVILLPMLIILTIKYQAWGVVISLIVSRIVGLFLNVYFSKKAFPDMNEKNILIPLFLIGVIFVIFFRWNNFLLSSLGFFLYLIILHGIKFIDFKGMFSQIRALIQNHRTL